MRYAIISDIHGNLAALQQVLSVIDQKGCDRLICLGDIVGYGPFPNECCDIIQNRADICVLGNHDAVITGEISLEYFNHHAKAALEWSAVVLKESARAFLAALPLTIAEKDLQFVHATPTSPAMWSYVLSAAGAREHLISMANDVAFIGHSHVPTAWLMNDNGVVERRSAVNLSIERGERCIINVGSVGQPRDRNPDACFGFYDVKAGKFELQRVPYDIAATQKAMRMFNLPSFLIERLSKGE